MWQSKKIFRQRGQSLLYVAVLIVILVSGVFFVFDIGNMVNNKIKLQNGADSAALGAVAVKISKHHVDTLVRTSMYHEALAAQSQQRSAQALLAKIILDIDKPQTPTPIELPVEPEPGIPGAPPPPAVPSEKQREDAARYRKLVNLTYRHAVKFHREKKALEAYYQWLADDSSGKAGIAVLEASRVGFVSNTRGLTNPANRDLKDNLKILTDKNQLIENQRTYNDAIGGVIYANEGAHIVGNFGKTYVEFDGTAVNTTYGTSFLRYFDKYLLTTNASARIASSDELRMDKNLISSFMGNGFFVPFEMTWHTPRLMSIEKKTNVVIH